MKFFSPHRITLQRGSAAECRANVQVTEETEEQLDSLALK